VQFIVLRFHSDGSVNGWGYKATVTGTSADSVPFESPPFQVDMLGAEAATVSALKTFAGDATATRTQHDYFD
jgi:hypothetical protein